MPSSSPGKRSRYSRSGLVEPASRSRLYASRKASRGEGGLAPGSMGCEAAQLNAGTAAAHDNGGRGSASAPPLVGVDGGVPGLHGLRVEGVRAEGRVRVVPDPGAGGEAQAESRLARAPAVVVVLEGAEAEALVEAADAFDHGAGDQHAEEGERRDLP